MLCRNMGLLCVLWACWLRLQCCPTPDWSNWKDIEKPLTQANRSGEFSFTAPHTATFLVQIKFPYEPEARRAIAMKKLTQGARNAHQNAFACQVLDTETHVAENYHGPAWLVSQGENLLGINSFEAIEGHRYKVRVIGNQNVPALRTLHPVVQLTYDPVMEKYKHWHEDEKCWSVLLLLLGIPLTFFGSSRIPLRGWFRTKPRTA